jgi:hypothetical protein
MKRPAELHLWTVKDLDGIAAWVSEFEDFEHVALNRFLL